MDTKKEEPVIVSAVGISSSAVSNEELSARTQIAMEQAVQWCLDSGVPIEDSKTIKAAVLAAIQRVRAEHGFPE